MTDFAIPQIVDDVRDLRVRDHIVTIGTFDGVHRGHAHLIERVVTRARELDLPALIVTFEPVPAQVLRPQLFPGRLCSAASKLDQLAQSGVDAVAVLPFTLEFSQLGPEAFMAQLVRYARPREVWVGEAFALGRNRTGNVDRLREIGRELRYRLVAVPRLTEDDAVISSSAIRQQIAAGHPDEAAGALGRWFRLEGEVIHGAHVGRTIGFPTANVVPPAEIVALPDGIYATFAGLPHRSGRLPAMTYIGTRPALNSGERLIETHILDFDEDIYGRWITVDFVSHLRGDANFPGVDALVAQLRADEVATRAVLGGISDRQAPALASASLSAN